MPRFRIKDLDEKVGYDELLEALTEQVAIDDAKIDEKSLRPNGDGTLMVEFEVSNAEATLLRGPMKQAKIFIASLRRSMMIGFEEVKPGGGGGSGSSEPSTKASGGPPGGGGGSSSSSSQEPSKKASGGPRPSTGSRPGTLQPPPAARALEPDFLQQKMSGSQQKIDAKPSSLRGRYGAYGEDSDSDGSPPSKKALGQRTASHSPEPEPRLDRKTYEGRSSLSSLSGPNALPQNRHNSAEDAAVHERHFFGDEEGGNNVPWAPFCQQPQEGERITGAVRAPLPAASRRREVPRFDAQAQKQRPSSNRRDAPPRFDPPAERATVRDRYSDDDEDDGDRASPTAASGRPNIPQGSDGRGGERCPLPPREPGVAEGRGGQPPAAAPDGVAPDLAKPGRLEQTWGPADMAYCTRFLGEADGGAKSLRDSCTTPCAVQ